MPEKIEYLCTFFDVNARCTKPSPGIKTFPLDFPSCLKKGHCQPGLKLVQLENLDTPVTLGGFYKLLEDTAREQSMCTKSQPSAITHKTVSQKLQDIYFNIETPLDLNSLVKTKYKLAKLPVGKRINTQFETIDYFRYLLTNQMSKPGYDNRMLDTGLLSLIESHFRRKRFYGKFDNIHHIIIPAKIEDIHDDRIIKERGVFSFLTVMDLHSTGRNNFAKLVAKTLLYHRAPSNPNLKHQMPYIRVINKILEGRGGVCELDLLVEASQNNYFISQLEALKNQFQAGLPSLGKRR